jgi:hypothetical protein
MERLSLWRNRKVIVKSLGKLLRLSDQKSAKKKDARVLWYLLASKTLERRLEFTALALFHAKERLTFPASQP